MTNRSKLSKLGLTQSNQSKRQSQKCLKYLSTVNQMRGQNQIMKMATTIEEEE